MQKTKKKANKGFTLVELIVVIGIIGILAVVAIVAFGGIQESAQRAVIQATANQVVSQLNNFNIQAASASEARPGGNAAGLTPAQLDGGIRLLIHPTLEVVPGDGGFVIPAAPGGVHSINSVGGVFLELGIEPIGNQNLAQQIATVLSWNATLSRWEINDTILAQMPNLPAGTPLLGLNANLFAAPAP